MLFFIFFFNFYFQESAIRIWLVFKTSILYDRQVEFATKQVLFAYRSFRLFLFSFEQCQWQYTDCKQKLCITWGETAQSTNAIKREAVMTFFPMVLLSSKVEKIFSCDFELTSYSLQKDIDLGVYKVNCACLDDTLLQVMCVLCKHKKTVLKQIQKLTNRFQAKKSIPPPVMLNQYLVSCHSRQLSDLVKNRPLQHC